MGLAVSGQSFAADKDYIEQALVDVCKAIQSGNRLNLNKTLKEYRLNYRVIQEKLVCNGQDPITFARNSGAMDSATLIAKRSGLPSDEMMAQVEDN